MSSRRLLYTFRFLRRWGHSLLCSFPRIRASHMNTLLSAIHAHARPTSAKTNTKILKSMDNSVNCIRSANQTPGSNSMQKENRDATTTVITKGTRRLDQCISQAIDNSLTVSLHRLSERWANTEHNPRKRILETGY